MGRVRWSSPPVQGCTKWMTDHTAMRIARSLTEAQVSAQTSEHSLLDLPAALKRSHSGTPKSSSNWNEQRPKRCMQATAFTQVTYALRALGHMPALPRCNASFELSLYPCNLASVQAAHQSSRQPAAVAALQQCRATSSCSHGSEYELEQKQHEACQQSYAVRRQLVMQQQPALYRYWAPVLHNAVFCRLLGAEDAVIEAGGIVIRLVGLYHANR